ncbi:MAG: DUF3006 domain-containing protein [Oscillospiraceae bacterium]|nr:DUF3006 domain-containing protein [Oscillospiraceae bacterium]
MACKFYTVDRIENGFAIIYDSKDNKSDVEITRLPEDLKEGDILSFDEENKIYIIDEEKTNQKKSNIEKRFKKLFKNI